MLFAWVLTARTHGSGFRFRELDVCCRRRCLPMRGSRRGFGVT